MEDTIQKLINKSINRGLPSQEEKIILEYLKSIKEVEALEILKYMAEQNSSVVFSVAKRVLHTKDYVKSFFEYGLLISNAQSIELWLKFAIHKIGLKSLIYSLKKMSNESNRIIEKATYWLLRLISKDDTKSQNLIQNLRDEFKEYKLRSDA